MVIIFDVDGTLIDSVKAHAAAWQIVLREFGFDVPFDNIRAEIGKGSDQLLKVFLSPDEIERVGEAISEKRAEIFKEQYMPIVSPFPGVRDLFERIREDGHSIVLGTSAKAEELETYLDRLGISDLVDGSTSADHVAKSKPNPDIFLAALGSIEGATPDDAYVIGDTPYDAQAACSGGMKPVGVLCGGFSEEQLRQAGCVAVYPDVAAILARYDEVPWRSRALQN